MKKNYESGGGLCLIPKKLMLVMKLTAILVIIFTVQVTATVYSQNKKLSLNLQERSIKEVLQQIEAQSEYRFIYENEKVNLDEKVSIQVTDEVVEKILKQLFEKDGINYSITGNNLILINPSDKPVDNSNKGQSNSQQQKSVSGKVTDSAGGSLPGVSVVVKGTTMGVITDMEGNYTLSKVPENSTLQFSFVGMKTQEIPVANKTTINVSLIEETIGLEEVVAVGYGTQKTTTITGSVSAVKGEKLATAPAINFSNSVAGRLPGLVTVTRSGEPGADGSTFRIRGANTLGDNSPLIVVDGVANRGLDRLSSSDIESISVLKDASAAIYGAQAANGVILITTKRGKQGKPEVNFSYNQGWSSPTVLPDCIDAATYLEMLNEINVYAGQKPKYSADEIQKYREGSDPWKYPNTDWYAETFKNAAIQRLASLTINGGQEKLTYFISAGTNLQDGIYKNGATDYKQSNFRVNLDGKLSEYVKYGIDLAGREQGSNYPTRSASEIFQFLRRGKPNMPAYWPNGKTGPDIEYGDNPVVITTNQTGYDRNKTTILETKAKLDIQIPWIKGLSISGNAALDKTFKNDKLWEIPWYLYSWDGVSYDSNNLPILKEGKKGLTNPQLTQDMVDSKILTLNTLVSYETKILEKHNLKILVGTERISGNSMNFSAFRKYYVSGAIDELFAGGDAEKTNTGSSSETARLNYFGRVNYDYLSKYLFEFVWRYDGSYIFPETKRFGFFPGVSLGWRMSEENFWTGIKHIVNHFKLRGSWGQTGNDRIETYQYLSSYGFVTGTSSIYTFNSNVENKVLNELRIPNPNVTWEVANQSNIGFDAQMFDGKISFGGDYFYNLRSDILWQRNASVPESSGLTLPRENIGKVVNQGAEFQASYKNHLGSFNYEVSANISFNRNKIKFWDETPGIPEYQKSTGHPMNSALYYNSIGIFRDQAAVDAYPHWTGARPGDIIFEDVNKDSKIDGLDRVRIYKTDLPTHTGGLNFDLSYKNFYTSIFLQWATGAVRNNYYEMQGEVGNFLKQDVEGRWTTSNPDASKPRIWNRYTEYWRNNQNTYWLQNSDYIRLKNLEIGYNVPKTACSKLYLNGMRVYFTGLNLLTLTKVKDFDPETTSATSYPLNRVLNLGLTLTF